MFAKVFKEAQQASAITRDLLLRCLQVKDSLLCSCSDGIALLLQSVFNH